MPLLGRVAAWWTNLLEHPQLTHGFVGITQLTHLGSTAFSVVSDFAGGDVRQSGRGDLAASSGLGGYICPNTGAGGALVADCKGRWRGLT